jgi:hypothetical protein
MASPVFDSSASSPNTFPPLMSLSGQSASQERKFAALGHRDMSRPTSLNKGNAFSSNPGI